MTPEYLCKILRYEPETGKLYWLERDESHGPRHRWFNTRYAGKEAMTSRKNSGHMSGPIGGNTLMAHRVAWAIHYGAWPDGWLDHINGDPSDNRIENLRLADPAINSHNRRQSSRPKGYWPGVGVKGNGRYFAQIQHDKRNHHLGYFACPTSAMIAYERGKKSLGFHENHNAILRALRSMEPDR